MKNRQFITLAIESSCDETSVAIIADGRSLLSNIISSQITVHQVFGGVVPEIASRHHLERINDVLDEALNEADISIKDVDLIGVTQGPGLVGALLIGIAEAKALSFANKIPLVGVHHIHGHISANYIEHKDLKPPFLALIVSGGHTTLAEVNDYNQAKILGSTRDDAVGEAFDKVARVLGLGYPGGPAIDKISKDGNCEAVPFKRVLLEKDSYDFSFSGTKTGVLNHLNRLKLKNEEINVADIAASFQQAVMDVIVTKTIMAAEALRKEKIVMAGGVAANSKLRSMMDSACKERGIELYYPSPILCTDNAAMVGVAAYYKYKLGIVSDLYMDAFANLPLE